jgi:hypothetical protein
VQSVDLLGGNNLGRKLAQMIPNDPKLMLLERLSFQSGPLILGDLGPLVGAMKRPAAAVRSRLWPPFRTNNLWRSPKSLRYEGFSYFFKFFIFNTMGAH